MKKLRLLVLVIELRFCWLAHISGKPSANGFCRSQWDTFLKQHVLPLNGGHADEIDIRLCR